MLQGLDNPECQPNQSAIIQRPESFSVAAAFAKECFWIWNFGRNPASDTRWADFNDYCRPSRPATFRTFFLHEITSSKSKEPEKQKTPSGALNLSSCALRSHTTSPRTFIRNDEDESVFCSAMHCLECNRCVKICQLCKRTSRLWGRDVTKRRRHFFLGIITM